MIGNFLEFFEIATDIANPTNSIAVKELFNGKSSSTTSSSIHGLEEYSLDGLLQHMIRLKKSSMKVMTFRTRMFWKNKCLPPQKT